MGPSLTREELTAYREGQMGLRPQPSVENHFAAQNAWWDGYPSEKSIMRAIYQQPANELANTVSSLVPERPYYPVSYNRDFFGDLYIDANRPGDIFNTSVPANQYSAAELNAMKEYMTSLRRGNTTPSIENNYAIPYINDYGGSPAVIFPSGDIQYADGPIYGANGKWNYDPEFGFEQWIRNDTDARLAHANAATSPMRRDSLASVANQRLDEALRQNRQNMVNIYGEGFNELP